MSHYSKANNQMGGYNNAISEIHLAKSLLEEASSELTKIYGVKSCEDLKVKIDARIEELETKVAGIKKSRNAILTRAKELDRREEEERRRKYLESLKQANSDGK